MIVSTLILTCDCYAEKLLRDVTIVMSTKKARKKTDTGYVDTIEIYIRNTRKVKHKKKRKTKTGDHKIDTRPVGPINITGTLYGIYKMEGGAHYSIERVELESGDEEMGFAAGQVKKPGKKGGKNAPKLVIQPGEKTTRTIVVNDVPGEKKFVDYVVAAKNNGRMVYFYTTSSRWKNVFDKIKKTRPGQLVNSKFERVEVEDDKKKGKK